MTTNGTTGTYIALYERRVKLVAAPRETQIIMQSPTSRASWSSTESQWSGTPSSTGVSQVPQVPSRHEDITRSPHLRSRSGSTSPAGRST